MAVDLTLEIFSTKLFRFMWRKLCGIEICDVPEQGEQCLNETFPSSTFCEEIFKSVYTRILLLWNYNVNYFERNYCQLSEYDTDFYICLQNTFHSRKYIEHINIFDKFLNVCEIAVMMGYACFLHYNSTGMDQALYTCAMFLDTEIKDEFYDAGDWEELKKHAHFYENLLVDVPLCCNDLKNAFEMFLAASINYDMDILMTVFQKVLSRISEHSKNVIYCSKCSLLLPSLTGMIFPKNCSSESIDVIEGLLQIVLSIKFFEKLSDNTLKSERATEIVMGAKNSNYSNLEIETNLNLKVDKTEHSEANYQTVNTLKFLIELFGEMEHETTQELDSCMICSRKLNKSQEHLIKEVQTSEVKCAKLNILNELNHCNLGEESLSLLSSQALTQKSVSKRTFNRATNIEPISTLYPSIRKITISDHKISPEKTTNAEYLKDILKLFIGLGIEPVKTRILTGLKNKYKESSEKKILHEKNCNLQKACDIASTITNQRLKVTHKNKKKRTKKKITVDANKNII